MNYLLDTHTIIWSLFETRKLSKKANDIILNLNNAIFVSSISIWEIALKYSLNKLTLPDTTPEELIEIVQRSGFHTTPLMPSIASSFHKLPLLHKDPFDRMLVWQAIQENCTLISKDAELTVYKKYGLSLVW